VAADDQGAHGAAGLVGRETDQALFEVAGNGLRVARASSRSSCANWACGSSRIGSPRCESFVVFWYLTDVSG